MKRVFSVLVGAASCALLLSSAEAEVIGLDEGANFVVGQFRAGKGQDLIQFRGSHVRIWLNQGDGSFKHQVFVPWLGYRVGNASEYLKGDFNGDGRTDFMHLLGRYVNTWFSSKKDDGTFELVRHDLPSSVPSVTRESQMKPVNIDGTMGHDVVQFAGNRVEIWMSYGNGDFHHHSFTPWSGYAVGDGTAFIKGLFMGGATEHLLHFAGSYAHLWKSDGEGSFNLCTFPFPSGYHADSAARFRMLRKGLYGASDLVQFLDTYSVIWTNIGNCKFELRPFTPGPGYGIGDGSDYVVGNFNGDQYTDLLHIVEGGTRYLHPWLRNSAGTFDVYGVDPPAQWDIENASSVLPLRINTSDQRDDLVHITKQDVRTWITLPGGISWNRYYTSLTSDYEFLFDRHEVTVTGGGTVRPASDGHYKLCNGVQYDFKANLCNWGYHYINEEIGVQWYEGDSEYTKYDTGIPKPLQCYLTAINVIHQAPGTRIMSVRANVPTVKGGVVYPEVDLTNNLYRFPPADWGRHPGCP